MAGRWRWGLVTPILVAAGVAAAAGDRVDIDVKDAEVGDVLRALADERQKNLVIADGVSGKVTLRLRRVKWRSAFEAVLRARELGAEESDGIIFVDSIDRIIARTERLAERRAVDEKNAELVTVVIPLHYARAEALKPILARHLSPRGSITVDARTNTLIITDRVEP